MSRRCRECRRESDTHTCRNCSWKEKCSLSRNGWRCTHSKKYHHDDPTHGRWSGIVIMYSGVEKS